MTASTSILSSRCTVMTRRLFVLLALLAVGGCSLDKQKAPGLTGPSELGLSLAISASPDVITQDGASQSRIEIIARDAASQPVRGLSMRIETGVVNPDGSTTVADIGSLSARTVSTDSEGRAVVTFTAPPPPPPTAGSDTLLTVIVTPIGSNYQNALARTVGLRLARPGVILPPNGTPKADFFYSPTAPREGDTILFDGSASSDDGQIVSYAWNFGDGDTGSGIRPGHSYEAAGTYNVVLTVTDDRGLTNSSLPKQIVVSSTADPAAAFTVSPTEPLAGTPVNVNGLTSKAAPGRRIVAYEWDFGDGSPGANGPTASHTYSQPGSYTIVLVVTDDLGKTGAAAEEITVKTSGPTASFTVTPGSPAVGVSAAFNASGSSAQLGRTITSYQWDFGDGSTGTNVTTSHIYTVAGTYTVTLKVTDSAGQTGTVSRTVTIVP